jgi:hypothetical protein
MSNRKKTKNSQAFGCNLPTFPMNVPKIGHDLHFANTTLAKYQIKEQKRQLTKYQKKRISKELKRKLKPIAHIQKLTKITADKEYYHKEDWLLKAERLVFDTTTSIDQAVKAITEKAKQTDLENFAHLYGYYMNYACMSFWQDDDTQFLSPSTHEPLFHLEHIRYLCAVMIRYVLSNENQPEYQILNKDIRLNYRKGECMNSAKELLTEMFSDGKTYRNVQDFISTSKSIEWNSDINLALYAYFNKGLQSIKSGIDETKIVFGAMVYFTSFINGELDMEYSPTTMPNDCKEEFAKYLKLNGIIFTS